MRATEEYRVVEETESCKVQSLVSFKCTGRFETGKRAKGGKRGAGGREGASAWSGGGTPRTHTVRRRGQRQHVKELSSPINSRP